MNTQQQSFLEMMDALNKRMAQFEGELQNTPPASNSISSLATDFAAFKSFTVQIMRQFQSQLGLMAQTVDNLEMNSRRKILLFHGLPEDKQEDAAALIVRTVTGNLNLTTFTAASISRCQRMGRAGGERPRPILVKLKDPEVRRKLWTSKTSLKGTDITLSEFLTKARHLAFVEARQRFGVKNCWTRDGFIYILEPNGKRHRVSSLSELQLITPEDILSPAPTAAPKKAVEVSVRPKRGATPLQKIYRS